MAIAKKTKTKAQPPATVQNFPIVGIGASAGGLDAFKRLLAAIPENSGMAYVLVQHLDPTHESILPEILQRVTKIPVHEITEDIHLAPNHIYVIPSSKMLFSTDGVLKLIEREKKVLNLSIDIFFTSLAEVHKEFAVGVVLSGTGSDGTLGLKAIKEHGGISMVQDSESAAYDSMPQSAVNADVVDFILAPEKIPSQLLQINSAYKTSHFFKKEEEELPKDDDDIFKQILLLLRQRSGVDFSYYKQPTFHRRIARRIAIVKKKNLAEYLKFLRTDKAEQDALFQDVLIPVTSFFRDPKTFLALTETVFPAILKNKAADEVIRIWIAGCSTGEEAYSIAICLHEFLGEKSAHPKIQIFASDISDKAIKKARAAIYTKADVGILSAIQVKNYFVKNNGGYEVNKLIRDMCVFAPHNFLKDPPFAKMDLITCRNVLIYMDTFLQKKAFTTFHYALKENGFLLLGKSETTGVTSDLFTQVNKHEKIYSRKPVPGRFMNIASEKGDLKTYSFKTNVTPRSVVVESDFRKSAEEIMILKSPASVVVNEAMDIVHIHGDITPFLQAPQGKPTHNLIKMAREGLAFELRNAVHKVKKEQISVIKENILVKANEKQFLVTIEIIPLTDTVEPHCLIRFEQKATPIADEQQQPSSGKMAETSRKLSGQNQQLEKELSQNRDDMRYITEDMEAANEELQSANEELQSSNEEMQSLNEELETSKEELQSTNEELTIVNQELLDKQEQLTASHYYAECIVSTIREPLIVLDKALRIKTANASFNKNFNIEGQDIEGKLFYEIQSHQWDDNVMRSLLEKILPKHERLTDFEIILKFPSIGERTLLLNALQIVNDKNSEQLILLAIEDITEHVAARKLIEASEKRFRTLSENIPHMIWTATPDGKKYFFNKYYLDYTGLSIEELIGGGVKKIIFPDDLKKDLQLWHHSLETGEDFNIEKRIRHHDGTYRWHISHGVAQKDEQGTIIGWIGSNTDIDEQKKITEVLAKGEEQFRTFANNIQNLAWIANGDGWIYWFNQRWYDYTETTLEDMEGWGWEKVHHPDHVQKILELTSELWKKGDAFELTFPLRRYDGEFRWFLTRAYPVKDADGKIERWIGTNTDIDEQKTFANELMEARLLAETARQIADEAKTKAETTTQIAEHATKAKQQFLSNMSHEIRTPMNAIIGFTKVLFKTDLTVKQKEYLEAIKSSGNTLIVLINDILDLAKVEAGKMIFVNSPFKISLSITTILHLFETKIQEQNLELVKEYDSRIPEILLGDSVRLHQILINLLSNAIKFTSKGKIIVSVNLLNEDEEKATIEFKVVDTGIGIPENKIETIFENFEQVASINSSLYGGTGLGLAIVKQLVEKQGGSILVKSKVDEGSTFSFTLSFQKTNADPDSFQEENGGEKYETKIKPLKVLVVEDVKINQLLMRTILDDFKFAWDIADNGKIAIEKLQTNSYDIILMDLQMPIMNGFEATEHIRNKMNLQIPIIALTADVTTVDLEKCKAIGMNDYISKPLDEKLLHSKILDLIKSK